MQFLSQFKNRKLNTRARYTHVLGAFFSYYNGEKLPVKIGPPKILPQYVHGEDIDRLVSGIKVKKSHKKTMERDVLLIETARMTGLRRGELSSLKVGDLHLDGNNPVLLVREGKGAKDRAVSLNSSIRDQLAYFCIVIQAVGNLIVGSWGWECSDLLSSEAGASQCPSQVVIGERGNKKLP